MEKLKTTQFSGQTNEEILENTKPEILRKYQRRIRDPNN